LGSVKLDGSLALLAIRYSLLAQFIMKARIRITLKNGVLDPQGKAIEGALASLGIGGVEEVRQGKYIEVRLAERDPGRAREIVERMCRDLLANMVIENYSFELEPT
jgi:phosphoribosylformylglycinamidine synthase subunit PurS